MKTDFWYVWTIPLILGAVSLFGLIAALVGDDVWDALSWLTLAIPLVVIGRFIWRPTAVKRRQKSDR